MGGAQNLTVIPISTLTDSRLSLCGSLITTVFCMVPLSQPQDGTGTRTVRGSAGKAVVYGHSADGRLRSGCRAVADAALRRSAAGHTWPGKTFARVVHVCRLSPRA